MKVLTELILNGEYIDGDMNDPSHIRYVLQYDVTNNSFNILIYANQNNRVEAARKMAEIIEEETGNQLERNKELALDKSTLRINLHGVRELLKHQRLKDTIELIQLTSSLQRSISTLHQIRKELIMFLLNNSPFSTLSPETPHFKYNISDKYHKTYQKRLMVAYCERLSDLLRPVITFTTHETIGITTIEDPPSLIISAEAMSQLQQILDPQGEIFPQFISLHESSVPVSPAVRQFLQYNSASQAALSPPVAPHLPNRIIAPPSNSTGLITSKENQEIDIDLELFFCTGEYYFTIDAYKYIASYNYDPSTPKLNIIVNKENCSNTIHDNLTPRTENCQRIVENIYRKIRTQYRLLSVTDVVLTKAEQKIDLSQQAINAIISDRSSQQASTIIKLINILHKPESMECNKLLFEIINNQNKYFRLMLVGNMYSITCNYGNTAFKPDPGISQQMSSILINRVQQLLNELFKDKYPALYNNSDMRSGILQKNPTGFTIKINKKACDDVLCDSYLQKAQINIPQQENIALNEAKGTLNSFIAPFKNRYLTTATITRVKEILKNAVTSLSAKMNNLDELCQFYEFLKSKDVINLLNAHKNPIYDSIFSKTNTNTWQEIIKIIRNRAFTLLRNETEQLKDSPNKAGLMSKYRDHPIFTDHRYNKFINRLHSTHTAREIDNLIASYRSPAITVN